MDIVFWSERFRGKKPSYNRYVPEYIDVVKIQNHTIRSKEDYKFKLPVSSSNIDKHLVKAYAPALAVIKANNGCTLTHSTKADYELFKAMQRLLGEELDISEHRVLYTEDFKGITKGSPASNANSRRSRAGKAAELVNVGRYEVMVEGDVDEHGKSGESGTMGQPGAKGGTKEKEVELVETMEGLGMANFEGLTFVKSKHGSIYHVPTCKYIKKLTPDERVELTAEEANSFLPCKTCIKQLLQQSRSLTVGVGDTTLEEKGKAEPIISDTVGKWGEEKVEKVEKVNTVEKVELVEKIAKHEEPINPNKQTEKIDTVKLEEPINPTKQTESEVTFSKTKITYNGVDPLGKQIVNICSRYGIFCELFGTTIRILTAAGGWKFDYTQRPIQLYHQNYKTFSNSLANIEYHLQPGEFLAPVNALAYLIKHDNHRIENMLKDLAD